MRVVFENHAEVKWWWQTTNYGEEILDLVDNVTDLYNHQQSNKKKEENSSDLFTPSPNIRMTTFTNKHDCK